MHLIEGYFINFNIICGSLVSDLNSERKIVFAMLMATLLVLGFSFKTGNQFHSVYSQEEDDSEKSLGEDQINTIFPLDNLTNRTAPDLNVTQSDEEAIPEDTSGTTGTADESVNEEDTVGGVENEDQADTSDVADSPARDESVPVSRESSGEDESGTIGPLENITTDENLTNFNNSVTDEETSPEETSVTGDTAEDELISGDTENTEVTNDTNTIALNQTDIPLGPGESTDNTTLDEGEATDQENQAPANFSGDTGFNSTETVGSDNSDNLTQTQENQGGTKNKLSATEPEQDLESTSTQLQNESEEASNVIQENETSTSGGTPNVTNESSVPFANSSDIDLLGENLNVTEDQALPPVEDETENQTEAPPTNATAQPVPNEDDTLAPIIPTEDTFDNQTSQEIEAASSNVAGVTTSTSTVENNQVSNIQNVINNIATGGGQSGGNTKQIATQVSKEITANPRGPVAKAIQTLAGEYSKGNSDEVNIAAKQIGTLLAKGNNIQQTLVQVTNKVVNNIKNIKTSIENYDKVIVNPKISSSDKNIIQQTINEIKKSKTEVDVPRVHIKFHTHERNLVLRILTTTNYKYEMPFSKYNGAFKLDDDEFRVKVLSGDGSVKSASVAKMFKSGKIGDREFLDKDIRNGKVFFSLDDVSDGKYLLEVYIKLSNGSIGTFARGSVSIG
jgi:hypothetical protein